MKESWLICLKRQEAIELLKEIVATCKTVSYTSITLKPPSEEATADAIERSGLLLVRTYSFVR